ncbi:probable prefoldin subunit 5 [Arabidopsis lyrata subsp. lyrata]|uniref:probable prefoldin subunit 5 n=1 Tax=Arabidopsis lyrata subsp. lyrata TaxID=81972 RepID=UPI000A29E589|nr:probable prefoldin subunit 5 [Arabidopsis lyrata subsp. lyrata]XP_020870921.1 probable prefoldin subunit 5 [Arabidopsis lyrata subsp. lyrata]|eukprot:XP_020866815.1 probable prefoldin subunit 5 [Arabidopsis lyrata subsp. lyrata]
MASSSSRGEMEKIGIDQLKALKEQADLEVNLLQNSLNNIRTATVRLDAAAAALNDLSPLIGDVTAAAARFRYGSVSMEVVIAYSPNDAR